MGRWGPASRFAQPLARASGPVVTRSQACRPRNPRRVGGSPAVRFRPSGDLRMMSCNFSDKPSNTARLNRSGSSEKYRRSLTRGGGWRSWLAHDRRHAHLCRLTLVVIDTMHTLSKEVFLVKAGEFVLRELLAAPVDEIGVEGGLVREAGRVPLRHDEGPVVHERFGQFPL